MIHKKQINKKSNKFVKKILTIFISVLLFASSGYATYLFISNEQAIQIEKQVKIDKENAIKAEIAAKEAKKKEPVYISLPGAQAIRAIVDDYNQTSSIWSLVNKTHSIPIDYIPSPISIPTGVATRTDKSIAERSIRTDIEVPMKNMFDAASSIGLKLMIGSGYRSAKQQGIYFNNLAGKVGDAVANQSIAKPGQSEHQTGLAADISTVSRNCYLSECFADTTDGQWLTNNSYKYGFILRYPKIKVAITGYRYEPWHFRYVGIDLATAIHESGLTLDETWPYLETARNTLIQNGAILQ